MTGDPMRQAGLARRLANMAKARRCGARTRTGRPCRQAAVRGRARCRMHGGAKGSGGPRGSRNGNFKHGFWDVFPGVLVNVRTIRSRPSSRGWELHDSALLHECSQLG
jgi:hypothetical protein